MAALAGLKSFAASRNGKLVLGGTAAGGVVAAGLLTRKRSGGDPSLIPYSEVQGSSGVNAGSFPSLAATGVSAGELEGLYSQIGTIADRVDALTEAELAARVRTPVPRLPMLPVRPVNPGPRPPTPRPINTLPVPRTTPTGTTGATYTVRPGDNLSAIASRLRVPGGWQALWYANRPLIGANPDLIRPGQRLTVPR